MCLRLRDVVLEQYLDALACIKSVLSVAQAWVGAGLEHHVS